MFWVAFGGNHKVSDTPGVPPPFSTLAGATQQVRPARTRSRQGRARAAACRRTTSMPASMWSCISTGDPLPRRIRDSGRVDQVPARRSESQRARSQEELPTLRPPGALHRKVGPPRPGSLLERGLGAFVPPAMGGATQSAPLPRRQPVGPCATNPFKIWRGMVAGKVAEESVLRGASACKGWRGSCSQPKRTC